jgi:hypothetical protein
MQRRMKKQSFGEVCFICNLKHATCNVIFEAGRRGLVGTGQQDAGAWLLPEFAHLEALTPERPDFL